MIPVSIFLIVFLVFALIVLLFTFFNIYHMVRFGKKGTATVVITSTYIIVVFALLLWSFLIISQADWTATINLTPSITTDFL